MFQFILQYWVEFAFGLIIAGVGFLLKHHWKLFKKTEEAKKQAFEEKIEKRIDDIYSKSLKDDEQLNTKIDILTDGLLSLQGQMFRKNCLKLLEKGHEITLDEYDQLIEDHDVYNSLNGNHKGDQLFELVKEKVKTEQKISLLKDGRIKK